MIKGILVSPLAFSFPHRYASLTDYDMMQIPRLLTAASGGAGVVVLMLAFWWRQQEPARKEEKADMKFVIGD